MLQAMCCSEELNLACYGSVTDVSVVALGAIQTEEIELVPPECIRRDSGGHC